MRPAGIAAWALALAEQVVWTCRLEAGQATCGPALVARVLSDEGWTWVWRGWLL